MAKTGPKPVADRGRKTPEFIEAMSIPEPNTGCWLWLGGYGANQYGTVHNGYLEPRQGAHRFSYQAHFPNENISGMQVHHKCQNRACVNPSHLEAVTPEEHGAKEFRLGTIPGHNSQKTHCIRGHELSGANLAEYISPRTGRTERKCKACEKERGNLRRRNNRRIRDGLEPERLDEIVWGIDHRKKTSSS